MKNYDDAIINDFILNAIDNYEPKELFYNELKQKISPLKTNILLLKDLINNPENIVENINNANDAIINLEKLIKFHFEKPNSEKLFNKFDILHVEDNELDRKTMILYFERKGISIKSVETAEECIDILRETIPKVILLDIDLKASKINGDELCKMLKSQKIYEKIPIILISAIISHNEKNKVLANTFADHIIMKPINKLADLDVILKYLNSS